MRDRAMELREVNVGSGSCRWRGHHGDVVRAGAGAEVAGVSQDCDYPPEVRKLPKVGTFLTPNIEANRGAAADDRDRPADVVGPARD